MTTSESNLRKLAYITLSDAKMLHKKRINPHKLLSNLNIDYTWTYLDNNAYGKIVKNYEGRIEIVINDNLSKVESNFELTLLLSTLILHKMDEKLKNNQQLMHYKTKENDLFNQGRNLALLLLAYSISGKERKKLGHKNVEKYVSKLAHKKGIPMRYFLQRIKYIQP